VGKNIWFNIVNTFSFWESTFWTNSNNSCNLENKNLQIERETQEQTSFKDLTLKKEKKLIGWDSIRLMDNIKNEKTNTTI
jgi:hypothetical protein